MTSKQINDKLYTITTVLADHFGFDADEAFELITDGDVNHAEEIRKLLVEKKPASKKAKEEVVQDEPSDEVKKLQHNISLWEKKLEAGDFKDKEAHVSKIDKEKKKLAKLLPPSKPVAAPAPKEKEKPAVKEVAEKRIKRFSPAMSTQLGTALEKEKLSLTDKFKKEFTTYIEELPDNEFRADSLAEHMRKFAELKSDAAGRASTGAGAASKKLEDEEPPHLEADEAAAAPTVTLKPEEMAKLKMLVATPDAEVMWDGAAKRHVKGPAMDEDEDMSEVLFKGNTYVVGDKTGRVYEAKEEGDVFMGFKGVGLFKTMS